MCIVTFKINSLFALLFSFFLYQLHLVGSWADPTYGMVSL